MEYLCCYTQTKGLTEADIRVAVVGEPACGKTTLIYRFSRGRLPRMDELSATTLDTDTLDVFHGSKKIKLTIQDTAGDEEYAKVRALAYNQCDVILLCFALDCPGSLSRIEADWAPEVTYLARGKPYLLVGLKQDLRDAYAEHPYEGDDFVSEKAGKKLAKQIRSAAYFECSADCGGLVKRIFGRAIREALKSL